MSQIECKDVSVKYESQVVLEDISFSIEQGDYLCIVGENGSGKSTLVKTILGLESSKTGKIVSNKIGKRTNNSFTINRATVRNIVLSFNPQYEEENELKKVEKLFVMLDEKFIGSQFNDNKDFMAKTSVIFESAESEYKYKKKEDS